MVADGDDPEHDEQKIQKAHFDVEHDHPLPSSASELTPTRRSHSGASGVPAALVGRHGTSQRSFEAASQTLRTLNPAPTLLLRLCRRGPGSLMGTGDAGASDAGAGGKRAGSFYGVFEDTEGHR